MLGPADEQRLAVDEAPEAAVGPEVEADPAEEGGRFGDQRPARDEVLVGRLRAIREDERGMTTEAVIITAVLAALAITVGIIITQKVTSKANSIPTG